MSVFCSGSCPHPSPTLPLVLMVMLSCQGPVTREQGISARHSEVSERHGCSDTTRSPLIFSSSPLGRRGCAEGSGCHRAADPTTLWGSHLVTLVPSWIKGCPTLCPPASDVQTREEPLKPPPRKQQLLFVLPESHYTELSPQLILCHLALTAQHLISQTPVLPCRHLDESISLLNHYLIKHWWF